jgi:glycosyltransferase A (GT-A) superfamily protein (DUF2064 family)
LNTQNTAILLFSRTAKIEAKAKHLALGKRASESVAALVIKTNYKKAHDSQLPVFIITEHQQRGTTFGERFANAFEDVFKKGFEKVIAIGNDCLTITTQEILNAADALNHGASVLGPTQDRGAYLIGLHKDHFHKQAFQELNWQSAATLTDLISYFDNQLCKPMLLSLKLDIDKISDWRLILESIPFGIKKQLIKLFDFGKSILNYFFVISIRDLYTSSHKSLRAPPLVF